MMEKLKVLEFDRRGEAPNNKIKGEIDKVTPGCNWVIPNGSPFFADSVIVYDEKGAELKLGKDYVLDGGLTPLIEVAGRNIVSFIKLSDEQTKANKTIKTSYTSIGLQYVPRNNLEEWIKEIQKGKIPVDWVTHVINKPDKFPVGLHLHSAKTEIGDWFELTWFFKLLTTMSNGKDKTMEPKIYKTISDAYDKLNKTFKDVLATVWEHDGNYSNPHKAKASHIEMGNVANMPTGSDQDHLDNKPNTLATPRGAKKMADDLQFDSESLLRTGITPISSYGNGSYIPPLIDGSFEGLGARFETGGLCLEADGRLVILGNQMDGRIDDLYYSIVDNYKASGAISNFTAYRYENESLKGFGCRPNYVIGGSGNEILFVGELKDPQYAYICLTNGTFDPSKHNFNKVDISEITTGPFASANTTAMNTGTIMLMGDWVYFSARRNVVGSEATGVRLYRFPTADLRPGVIPRFECMRITFTSMDDITYTDALDFRFLTPRYVDNGDGTRDEYYGWKFHPEPRAWSSRGWRALRQWCAEVPGSNKKRFAYHLRTKADFQYTWPGAGSSNVFNLCFDVCYHFDPETGHMERIAMTPLLDIDFTVLSASEVASKCWPYNQHGGQFHHIMAYGSTVVLEDGNILATFTDDAKTYPRYVYNIDTGFTNRYDATITPLTVPQAPDQKAKDIRFKLNSPLPSGIYQHMLMFDEEGEYYSAREGRSNTRRWFYRKVTGGWEEREGVTNIDLPNLKSRPLTTAVYSCIDVMVQNTLTSITGDDAVLAKAGVEMGCANYASVIFRNNAQMTPYGNWDKHVDGAYYSFPRTATKVFDEGNKRVKMDYKTYYSFDDTLMPKIYSELMNYVQDTDGDTIMTDYTVDPCLCLTVFQQNGEDGKVFEGMNFAVLTLHAIHKTEPWTGTWLYTLKLDIEPPGTDHPNSYKIIGFTPISRVAKGQVITAISGRTFGILTADYHATLMIYRSEDDGIRYLWRSGIARANTGNNVYHVYQFGTNLNGELTGATNISNNGWNMGASSSNMMPRLGGFRGGNSFNGGAALTAQLPEGNYLLTSVYPEVGWVLFFQEGTQVIFNGTDYMMPSGSVDLRDIDRETRNKTYYVYATIEADQPKYMISSIKMRHSPYLMLTAIVKTNEKQIISIDRYQRFMIGNYMLQTDREGGTIPVSIGLPMDEGKLIYVRRDELT